MRTIKAKAIASDVEIIDIHYLKYQYGFEGLSEVHYHILLTIEKFLVQELGFCVKNELLNELIIQF